MVQFTCSHCEVIHANCLFHGGCGESLFLFNKFLVPEVPLQGGIYTAALQGLGASRRMIEKEQDIILEQQPDVIVAFVSGKIMPTLYYQ